MKKILLSICAATLGFAADLCVPVLTDPCLPCGPVLPKNSNHPYFSLDYLYWFAKQEGDTYALTGTAITVPGTVDPNTDLVTPPISGSGTVYSPNPKAKSGAKATLGMNLARDGWDLYANYTYLSGVDNSSIQSNNLNDGIIPLFAYLSNNSILTTTTIYAASGATGFVSSASAAWHFLFNNINLELSKSIPLFSAVVLHPHFGLQGSWQTQHFQASYNVSSIANSATFLGNNTIHFHQTFWGVGPRVGLDSVWQLCNHLGLYSESGLSLLYGAFNAHSTAYDTNVAAGYQGVLLADQHFRPHTLSSVIEVALGLSTDWRFRTNYRFVASVGWDAQIWFAQNQHSSSISDTNLMFQGLDAKVRFDF